VTRSRFSLFAVRALAMRALSLVVGLTLCAVCQDAADGDERVVGWVKVIQGTAFVVRDSQVLPAQVGQTLVQTDTLRTGSDGRLGVILKDNTRLSLGPDSEIRIERFVFAPAQGQLELVVRVVRGIVAYVSGKIAELAPESVRVETPVAIVGIRGTRFAAKITEE
jgi:hypothetical protein